MSRMSIEPQRQHGRVDLAHAEHHAISTLEELRATAQLAMEVELTTIPAYLAALYSIVDRASDAYQVLRSVVMEEMFHVNQAANLLIGIGGEPRFTGTAVPVYPAYLPAANRERTPFVGLLRASPAVIRGVFMRIETPAPFAAPPEGSHYETIGQLYAALRDGLEACVKRYGEPAVFEPRPGLRQRSDVYLGKFGGHAIEVRSLETAQAAIMQIVQQGEGAVSMDGVLVADERFGAYHHYGTRSDGTYGPILGEPREPSHYIRFLGISGIEGFPDTLPVVSNPRLSDFTNREATLNARAFNKAYSLMLTTLEHAFRVAPPSADPYFQLTLPLMHQKLAHLAAVLMSTPVHPDGDPAVGPNAAPTFEFDARCSFADTIESLVSAHAAAARPDVAHKGPSHARRTRLDQLIHDFHALEDRAKRAGLSL